MSEQERVLAYGRYPGTVVDEVAFGAVVVRTDLVPVEGKKRRQRLTLIVHRSNLEALVPSGVGGERPS